MPTGLLAGIGSAVGIAGNVASIFRDEPDQQFASRPPFRGTITTPAFSFGGGTLARTGQDAFSAGGFASSLAGVRTGLTGLQSRVGALRPEIAGGLRSAQGLFGRGEALRGDIQGLDQDLAGLQGQVRPGFGRLTESAVNTIRNRAAQSAGNLRESLARRNILGASFANAQQASIERDFAQLEEQTRAQAIVQEIEATRQIVKDRAGLVDLSGRLLELDQRSLQEQARFIALDLQATEEEANIFTQQVNVIQTEMQAFRDQVNRELTELGLSTDFLSIVDQIISGNATSQVQQAADSIGGGGVSGEGEGGPGGQGGAAGGAGEGPGGPGGGGSGTGGGACFAKGTLVEMQDGSETPIEDIQIGQETRGGRVTGVMTFDGDDHAYDYQGITVAGSHEVYEDGSWKRVDDSKQGIKSTEPIDRWYVFDTTRHEIWANDILFGDFVSIHRKHPSERALDVLARLEAA